MKPVLYHYVHCPYCLRVRMAAGFLNISFESKVLRYDDEVTPKNLIGQKMCPIWVDETGKAMPESLDIIKKIDLKNILNAEKVLQSTEWGKLSSNLNEMGKLVHNLAMPHWIYTKEFDEASRNYFQRKKEEKRGSFDELVRNRNEFELELNQKFLEFEKNISGFYKSDQFGLLDILIASQIWGLYVVPEFQFSEKMHGYLQKIKKICKFNYHADLWK